MSARQAGAALTVAIVAGLLAGCGIPLDAHPRMLTPSGVPFHLLSPSVSSPTTTTQPPSTVEVPIHVFLLDSSGHLTSRQRLVPAFPSELDAVLNALVYGPTSAEAATHITSAVPPATKVLSTSINGGLATVNLDQSVGELVGSAQLQAIAQIVYTATDLPGVSSVTFQIGGAPVEVPVPGGPPASVATRAVFPDFAPLGAPAP